MTTVYAEHQDDELIPPPQLVSQAKAHWQEFLPTMYRQYQKQGILQDKLNQAAEQAYQAMNQLEEAGHSPSEAREIVLPQYILLTPEASE